MKPSFLAAKDKLKMYLPGDLVTFYHLNISTHLNGTYGVVISYLPCNERYEVRPIRSEESVYVKPNNLTQRGLITQDHLQFKHKNLISAAFWPDVNGHIPIQALPDWPADWTKEMEYLRNTRKWYKPFVISGITSRKSDKPDFVIYFDAGDEESPVNYAAETIFANLPLWEQSKVRVGCGDSIRIRGVCILCYDPTKVEIGFVTEDEDVPPLPSPDNQQNGTKLFSLEAMQYMLYDMVFNSSSEEEFNE